MEWSASPRNIQLRDVCYYFLFIEISQQFLFWPYVVKWSYNLKDEKEEIAAFLKTLQIL